MTIELPRLRLAFLDALRNCGLEVSEYMLRGPSGRPTKGRDQAFAHFRAAFVHYCRHHYQPQPSFPEIAQVLGLASHSPAVKIAKGPLTEKADGMLKIMVDAADVSH